MISIEQLLERGYVEHHVGAKSRMFKKGFSDKKGIRFEIRCYEINHDNIFGPSYEFQVDLIPKQCARTYFRVWKTPGITLDHMEKLFGKMWTSLHCEYLESFPKPKKNKWRQRDLEEQIAEEKLNGEK